MRNRRDFVLLRDDAAVEGMNDSTLLPSTLPSITARPNQRPPARLGCSNDT